MSFTLGFGVSTTQKQSPTILSTLSYISDLIAANATDIDILVVGDSTGDTTSEWVYSFFDGLNVPSHTVKYYSWNDTSNVYNSPTTISGGFGIRSINVYNASVGGARGMYFLGTKYTNAIAALSPDLIIFNFGINSSAAGTDILIRGEIVTPIAQIHDTHPNARLVGIKQNPNRDSTVITAVAAAWDAVSALLPEMAIVDVHQAFLDLSKDSGLYSDAIHPDAEGTAVYVSTINSAWYSELLSTATPWLDSTSTDILINGNFSDFTGATPTSWTVSTNTTSVKELTIIDPLGNPGWSVKLNATGAQTFNRLLQTFTTGQRDAIRGQTVTIAARVYIPANMPQGGGRLAFAYNSAGSGNLTITTRTETQGRDGWHWIVIPGVPVPADATSPVVSLYYDSAAPSVADGVYWGRAIMTISSTPKLAA